MDMSIVKEKAPHLRRPGSTTAMLLDVLIALLPVTIFAFIFGGLRVLMMFGISDLAMLLAEFVYVGIRYCPKADIKDRPDKTLLSRKECISYRKRVFAEKFKAAYHHFAPHDILAPLVSSHIFVLIMPASASWYAILVSSLFGIIVGKLVFGGLGNNIFNPAAAARIFAALCFGKEFTYPHVDTKIGGTPLGILKTESLTMIGKYDPLTLFLGHDPVSKAFLPGMVGETCKLAILLGAIYLFARRSADLRVSIAGLVTFVILFAFAGLALWVKDRTLNVGQFLLYHLFSGGLLFGLVFMATDPVTSPNGKAARIAFGTLLAVFTVLIRFFAATPEGMAFSILLVNALAPLLDAPKLSPHRYRYWHSLIWVSLMGVMILLFFVTLPGMVKGA